MPATTEKCANCGVVIGNLEAPFVWKDQVVCGDCHAKLNKAIPLAYASRTEAPQIPPPAAAAKNDEVLFETRRHWIIFVLPVLLCFVWGIGVVILPFVLLYYFNSKFMVTNRRLIVRSGWLIRQTNEMMLQKIESLGVKQGFSGRGWGFGTLVITGTGGSHQSLTTIARVNEFRDAVAMAMENLSVRS